jgi:hypothetical protein
MHVAAAAAAAAAADCRALVVQACTTKDLHYTRLDKSCDTVSALLCGRDSVSYVQLLQTVYVQLLQTASTAELYKSTNGSAWIV